MKNIFKDIFSQKSEEKITQPKEIAVASRPSSGRYSPEIEQIHHEFEIASDVLVAQAAKHIEEANQKPVEKVKRLMSLGFSQAQQVNETKVVIERAELSEEQIRLVQEFKRKYPLNKFITEEQVKAICYKYNLICGAVSKYRGFVPEKNMKEIEAFNLKEEDLTDKIEYGHANYTEKEWLEKWNCATKEEFLRGNRLCADFYDKSRRTKKVKQALEICAPVKDMDMTGMTIADGYRMTKIHIPDPVVLQPVKNGYLILTAWGDEAADPMVVNEINN